MIAMTSIPSFDPISLLAKLKELVIDKFIKARLTKIINNATTIIAKSERLKNIILANDTKSKMFQLSIYDEVILDSIYLKYQKNIMIKEIQYLENHEI